MCASLRHGTMSACPRPTQPAKHINNVIKATTLFSWPPPHNCRVRFHSNARQHMRSPCARFQTTPSAPLPCPVHSAAWAVLYIDRQIFRKDAVSYKPGDPATRRVLTLRMWSNHSLSSAASSGTLMTLKGPSNSGLGLNSKSSMSPPTTSLEMRVWRGAEGGCACWSKRGEGDVACIRVETHKKHQAGGLGERGKSSWEERGEKRTADGEVSIGSQGVEWQHRADWNEHGPQRGATSCNCFPKQTRLK